MTPQQTAAAVLAAANASLSAESAQAPDTPIHMARIQGNQLPTGSLALGIRCDATADTARLTCLAAMSTEWAGLIDSVEVVDLNAQDRGVIIQVSNTSDSVTFLSTRLRRACLAIAAAAGTIEGTDPAQVYTTKELALRDLQQSHPSREALHQQIVQMLYGGKAAEADSIELAGIHAQLNDPGHLGAEDFARLQTIAEKVERRLGDPKASPDTPALYGALTEIIDKSPWMMIPGESIVRKNSYAERSRA